MAFVFSCIWKRNGSSSLKHRFPPDMLRVVLISSEDSFPRGYSFLTFLNVPVRHQKTQILDARLFSLPRFYQEKALSGGLGWISGVVEMTLPMFRASVHEDLAIPLNGDTATTPLRANAFSSGVAPKTRVKFSEQRVFLLGTTRKNSSPKRLELQRPAIKFPLIQMTGVPWNVGKMPTVGAPRLLPAAAASPTFPGMCLCVRAEMVRSRSCGGARCQVYFRRRGFELFKMHIVCVHLTKENASSERPGLLACQMIKSSSPTAEGSLSMALPGQGIRSRVGGNGWPFAGTSG